MNNSEIELRFQRRNIANCLATIFPITFTPEENAAIAQEILRLMGLLNNNFKDVFSEFEFLIIEAEQRCLVENATLNNLLHRIKKDKTLKTQFVPAFICSELKMVSYNQAQFEQYKALTLIVCLRLMLMGEHDSAVKNVCNEIRLYSDGRRDNLIPWLPDINNRMLHELIVELDTLRQQASDNPETMTVSNQLSHFYVSYHDSHEFNSGIRRNMSSREFTKTSMIRVSAAESLDDDIDATVAELREFTHADENWQKEENSSGHTIILKIVTLTSSGSNCYATELLVAKATANRMLKKKMSFTCDPYLPTTFEIHKLIQECTIALTSDSTSTAQLLLLMLFLGISADQVRQLKPTKFDQQIIGITREHVLPTQAHRAELTPLLKQVSSTFMLPIPISVHAGIKSFKFEDVNDAQITSFIQKINKKHSCHITRTKISACLAHKMNQESIDPVFTELIKGSQINSLAALSYTQI